MPPAEYFAQSLHQLNFQCALVLAPSNQVTMMLMGYLQVTHLMRCSGTVSLAAAACSMDVLRVWGRYVLCFLVGHLHAEQACRQHIRCHRFSA